jgi:hypothetical protein
MKLAREARPALRDRDEGFETEINAKPSFFFASLR